MHHDGNSRATEKPRMDMLARFHGLRPQVTVTTLRPCHRVALALLVMTGRGTRLGLSRWAGPGGSDRTVPRVCSTVRPWATLVWVFWRQPLYRPGEVSLVAGDAVVVTQAGPHPHGLERCFARLDGTPVPGLAGFTGSWVRTQARRVLPGPVAPVGRRDAEQAASQATAAAKPQPPSTGQRRRGRPQGRTHKPTADVPFTPALGPSNRLITAVRPRVVAAISVPDVVRDGPVGHHHAVHRARPCPVHGISTRRADAAWSWPDTGL